MPEGARKMEQFRAVQVANEIRDEDHAGNATVEVAGNTLKRQFSILTFFPDKFSDNIQKFFDSLGEGSMDDIPEDDEDDEESDNKAKK